MSQLTSHATIHLNEAHGGEEPNIPVHLFAFKGSDSGLDRSSVSVEFGDAGSGKFGMQLSSRSARYLARYLEAFADTADGVPAREGDPTRDAPPLTDADAPETVAA